MPAEWQLLVGRTRTGYFVRQDDKYPTIWRIYAPDGRVSDMVNFSRAKDAARSWAMPKDGGFGDKVLSWLPTETRWEAP